MKISKINFLKSSPNSNECPKSNLKEFAFIGRSNVGKSKGGEQYANIRYYLATDNSISFDLTNANKVTLRKYQS